MPCKKPGGNRFRPWHGYFCDDLENIAYKHDNKIIMIIEVVVFFIWVFFVLLIGAIVTVRRRKKARLQGTENISARLTFPQRNWLPLCILIAIVSPLAVRAFKAMTHEKPRQAPVTQNGAAYQPGDSAGRDTSYHVAAPPQH